MPNSQVSVHWSKDFVEHLRTVHFALVTIAAGLILLVSSSKQYNAPAALVEIEEIIALKKDWSPGWVASNAPIEKMVQSKTFTFDNTYFAPPEFTYVAKVTTENTKPEILIFRCKKPKADWDAIRQQVVKADEFPTSLTGFEHWWNHLGTHGFLVSFPLGVERKGKYTFHNNGHAGQIEFEVYQSNDQLPASEQSNANILSADLAIEALDSPQGYTYLFGYTFNYVDPQSGPIEVKLPISDFSIARVKQETIGFAYKNFAVGSFEKVFRDLFVAARERADLPLEDIREFLHDEVSKGSEVFEAFGMKFPAGQITFWGFILLLSVQLYFATYLTQGGLLSSNEGKTIPLHTRKKVSGSATQLEG